MEYSDILGVVIGFIVITAIYSLFDGLEVGE